MENSLRSVARNLGDGGCHSAVARKAGLLPLLFFNRSFYHPGDCVTGRLCLTASKDFLCAAIDIQVEGQEVVHWYQHPIGTQALGTDFFKHAELPLTLSVSGPLRGVPDILAAGRQYEFDFAVMLPQQLRCSYEKHHTEHIGQRLVRDVLAAVRYCVVATIRSGSPSSKDVDPLDVTLRKEVHVYQRVDDDPSKGEDVEEQQLVVKSYLRQPPAQRTGSAVGRMQHAASPKPGRDKGVGHANSASQPAGLVAPQRSQGRDEERAAAWPTSPPAVEAIEMDARRPFVLVRTLWPCFTPGGSVPLQVMVHGAGLPPGRVVRCIATMVQAWSFGGLGAGAHLTESFSEDEVSGQMQVNADCSAATFLVSVPLPLKAKRVSIPGCMADWTPKAPLAPSLKGLLFRCSHYVRLRFFDRPPWQRLLQFGNVGDCVEVRLPLRIDMPAIQAQDNLAMSPPDWYPCNVDSTIKPLVLTLEHCEEARVARM